MAVSLPASRSHGSALVLSQKLRRIELETVAPAATIGIFMGAIWIAFAAPAVNDKRFWPVALASIPLPLAAAWLFARLLGFLVLVPIVEELAFRGFLARRIIDSDFDKVPLGTFSWSSFLVSSAVFGAMHGRLWIVGTLAGMLFAAAHIVADRLEMRCRRMRRLTA